MKSAKKISPVLKNHTPAIQLKKTGSGTGSPKACTTTENADCETLINFTDDLLWSIDTELKLITANRSYLQHISDAAGIMLKPGDDILIKDFFSADFVAFWETCYTKALAGESFSEEIYAPASGKRKASWTETKFNPIFNGGKVTGIACNSRNITEKKSAEEKIRQREARLTETQEIAKVGSWETDLNTFEVIWSEETYRIFELDPAGFKSSHEGFLAFIHPDDRAGVDAAFKKSFTDSSINTIEHRIITSKGNTKIVEERWRIYHDETGKPSRAAGTCRDITEHKLAEAAIQKVYKDKTTILESIDDGFFSIDQNSLVTYWNRRAEIMLGEKREEIIGKNLHEVFGATGSQVFYQNYQKAIREKITIHFEAYSNRSQKWLSVSAFGSDNGLSVYFKDITEQKIATEKLKESEIRYRSLIEQATDAICIADVNMKIIDINAYGCQMLDYSKEEFLQLSIVDLFVEEDLAANPFRLDELKSGKIIRSERRFKRKNGDLIEVEISTKIMEDGRFIVFGHDIVDRKTAENKLKQSETKYRTLFEQNMAGVYQSTLSGEILNCNHAFAKMLKYDSPEDILRVNASDLYFSPGDRIEFTDKMTNQKNLNNYESILKCKDGSPLHFIENISLRKDEVTGEVFFDGIIIDITEKKEAELKLKESNELYNLVSQATNDMVWDWDLQTGKVYRNKEGWKKIFRTGDNHIENELIDDWDNRVHPDDREKVKQVEDEIQKSEKDFFEVECRVLRDDGTYAYVNDRGNIFRNEQGKAVRLIGATQDITARKEAEIQLAKSELRFRSLIQNGSDLVGILDNRGYYLYSSPAVKKILGYEPEFMIGKNSFSFIHPDDINSIKTHLEKKIEKNDLRVFDFRFKNAAGEWRWLECKVTDMSNNPEIHGYIYNSRDITERKIAEEEIKKLSIIARETVNAVILTDPEGKILWVNEAFTRITEYGQKEVLGRKPGDFLQGEESSPAVVLFMRQEIKKLKSFECDIINYSKSGRKYWLHIQCQPQFDESGRLKYFFAIQTDISKEKEAEEILKTSEERYRYLFNNNPASIIIWDIETLGILEINETAIAMYGYSREDFLAKTILDLRLPVYHDLVKEFAARAREKPDFVSVNTWKHINRSGDDIYMNIGSHRIEFKGQSVILSLGTNITEKVYLEKELEKQRLAKHKEITDAVISAQEQERQQLGGELHDNINQILAGSLLYLGLAKKNLHIEHPWLTETENLISSAIHEIRNLSHALIPPSLSESELVGALSNLMETTRRSSKLHINLQAYGFDESNLPDKLKLGIYRIVQEQFNNILKHAHAGRVIVRLTQDNEKTLLLIKDDGAGFDTSLKLGGVGLMNIKTRASLFNGELTINSSPGNGCELRVLFN